MKTPSLIKFLAVLLAVLTLPCLSRAATATKAALCSSTRAAFASAVRCASAGAHHRG